MITLKTLLFAFLGGLLPALLWLWFWLREDRRCPEPKWLIIFSFVVGMIIVPVVLPFEKLAATYIVGTAVVVLWAAIEEIFKYLGAYIAVLRRREMNEPIDAVIYMITVALGFAALENALFLLGPLADGNISASILTGNLRFFGATLLHTLSSATIGVAMALSFYKRKASKRVYVTVGVILSIILHSLFNFFIIETNGEKILTVFAFVWIGIIFLFLIFEKIKRIKNPKPLVSSKK